MDHEIRDGDTYEIDGNTRWYISRTTEIIDLANRIPSNVHIPDRTYKALISLIYQEMCRIDCKIGAVKKHTHIPSIV